MEAIERKPAQMIAFSHIDYWEATDTYSEAQYLQSIPLCSGREFVLQSHFFFTGAWSFLYQRSLFTAQGFRFKEGQLHEDDYLNFSLFGKVTEIYKLQQALIAACNDTGYFSDFFRELRHISEFVKIANSMIFYPMIDVELGVF
jgi:hypothetical protein